MVGVTDERWGQRVAAVVCCHEGTEAADVDDLADACRTLVAGYKIPRELHVVDRW